jgi:catechol 2,3-dioxygenase-like lactoylglutathione lyase family enzyme
MDETPPASGYHHVTLTVTDLERSATWYGDVLGCEELARREGPGWRRLVMRLPGGAVLGITAHDGTTEADAFDHRRVGLDHVGILCADRDALEAWQVHLDACGVRHGGITDAPYASAITCRDPDGIPIEFFVPGP